MEELNFWLISDIICQSQREAKTMKLLTNKLVIATAFAFSMLWIICSIIIILAPTLSMKLTGTMIHADLSSIEWTLTWGGFLTGLIAWTVIGGLSAWMIAFFYNQSQV